MCQHTHMWTHMHSHWGVKYVITSWFSVDRSFASLSFHRNPRSSMRMYSTVCVRRRCANSVMSKRECRGDGSGGGLHTCPGSGPRLCEAQSHQAAGCEDTKEKFFSTLSWLERSQLSLEQHGKWHNQTLNPSCFVYSSDHKSNHPEEYFEQHTMWP